MLSGIAPLFIFLHQLPKYQAFARVFGLCLSATNNVTNPGFILIVLLTILLWSYCSGRIVDHIALITLIALTVSLVVLLMASLWLLWLLWPYRWSYCWLHCFDRFDCFDRIAGHIALIFVLGSDLCFWYHSYYLLLKLRAAQDGIHRLDESRTYIWSSSRTHLRTLNRWII